MNKATKMLMVLALLALPAGSAFAAGTSAASVTLTINVTLSLAGSIQWTTNTNTSQTWTITGAAVSQSYDSSQANQHGATYSAMDLEINNTALYAQNISIACSSPGNWTLGAAIGANDTFMITGKMVRVVRLARH